MATDEEFIELAGRLMKLELRLDALEKRSGPSDTKEPVCRKCNDTGVIRYGVGQELDCECRESPFTKINNGKEKS